MRKDQAEQKQLAMVNPLHKWFGVHSNKTHRKTVTKTTVRFKFVNDFDG